MRWLIARYQPVSLFSLKHGEATSSGGKSLLVPTPFAVRTALLDVAIRVWGLDRAQGAFEHIRALHLALCPPERVAVSSLFTKVLKPERNPERGRAMQRTIAFREYVHLQGVLALALGGDPDHLEVVRPLLPHVTYFGKRGSFFQFLPPAGEVEAEEGQVPEGFVLLEGRPFWGTEGQAVREFTLGIIQRLDDWGPGLTFERVNVYSDEKIRLGRDRIRFDVVLPYRVVRAGRGFTVYEGLTA
ncbi:MAG TPA: hypothetical protein G4O00_12960 [Thermoflexia bacterium]|jgi:hypothetical protein|nr:hypothetical protein [Thermoflexia bacterium]